MQGVGSNTNCGEIGTLSLHDKVCEHQIIDVRIPLFRLQNPVQLLERLSTNPLATIPGGNRCFVLARQQQYQAVSQGRQWLRAATSASRELTRIEMLVFKYIRWPFSAMPKLHTNEG
jgi:hypothetical protein